MSSSPDFGVTQRKEAIRAKSPLLQAFLDPTAKSNQEMWKNIFTLEYIIVDAGRQKALEQNNQSTEKQLPILNSLLDRVFDPTVPRDFQMVITFVINAIGYEIGDPIEAVIFVNDIRRQLVTLRLLNTQPENEMISIDFIAHTIQMGVEAKKLAQNDYLAVFRDFIKKIE